jgi:MFS transporter, YNFM family, putative membrane transport protein
MIFIAYVFVTAGAIADRIGRKPVLISGLLLLAAGLALTLLTTLSGVVIGIVPITIGFFVTHSVASGRIGHLAGAERATQLYFTCWLITSGQVSWDRSEEAFGNMANGRRLRSTLLP